MYVFVYVGLGLIALYVFLRRGPGKGKAIPGPTGWPIAGFAFKMKRETLHDTFTELAEKYGAIFRLNAFRTSMVVLNNAEMIRSLYCDDPYKQVTNDRFKTFYLHTVLFGGNKAIFSTLDVHNSPHGELRKIFARGMHVYGEGIRSFEAKVHSELAKLNERIASYNGKEFDMQELIRISLSNIVSIFLIDKYIIYVQAYFGMPFQLSGADLGDDDPEASVFWELDRSADYLSRPDVDLIMTTFPFLRFVPSPYKEYLDTIMKAKETILKRYFHEAKRSYTPGTIRGLVDFYLAEQHLAEIEGHPVLVTDERICAMIIETIAGGILTTLSTLTSIFLCLVNYPEFQTKIQEELDRVVGRQELPTLSDRKNCVIIEAVSLEVQRYITSAPLSVPHLCKPNMEFKGYDIPANSVDCSKNYGVTALELRQSVSNGKFGTWRARPSIVELRALGLRPKLLVITGVIFANVWFVHHDEKIWGDPWTFRPERWMDNNGKLLPNNHTLRKNWLPFGTGRRQCAGESLARSRLFLYIATLLQRWNFEMLPEHAVSCDPRIGQFDVDITCRPKPYLCRAVHRK